MTYLVFGPNRPLSTVLREVGCEFDRGRARMAMAWARDGGVGRLLEALEGHMTAIDTVVGINERGTTAEALLRLLDRVSSLWVFFKHPSQTFHQKMYLFDDGLEMTQAATIIVGSSNLTSGGLVTNFEASAVIELDALATSREQRALWESALVGWEDLVGSPYCHVISSEEDVGQLFDAGYIVSERTARRRQRRASRHGSPSYRLPTSPPPRAPRLSLEPITSEFLLKEADEPDDAPEDVDPRGAVPLPERFFVRTLTPNDVLKLQGERPGTFEPDLGEMARDRFPGFWGWQLEYEEVERRLIRLEWRPTGRLFSSVAPPDGIPIVLTLWFRESRPGHAAEHRLGIGPIGDVRQATPPDFDTTSLLVVERAPEEAEYAYVVRLITQREPAYEDYASYLIVARPRHRFGYGP